MLEDDKQGLAEAEVPDAAQELEETRHRLHRLAADFDNFRKRTHREKEDLKERALKRFVLALLPVADDFERAVLHVGGSPTPTPEEAPGAPALTGLRMIHERMQLVLQGEGIQRFRSAGERFDPRLHDAVDHVYHDEVPAGHVIREAVPGYLYGDSVLRPARVVVSKGRESDSILFEFDIEEEESTEPNRVAPAGLGDEPG